MKTSVVMTTYNGRRFLMPMLDSLRDQTRKIDEVLIFDDKSSDDTVDMLNNYIKDNCLSGWEVKVNEENLGWEQNFVQALMSATGDVIFPCDQDDIWHLDKVEKMTAAFEDNADIWLLVSGYHAFSELGGKMAVQQKVRTESKGLISKVVFDEKYYQILRPGCTMAIRKNMLQIFERLWTPGTPHDAILWGISSIIGKLYLYDDTFIEYRRHDSNASKEISHGYKYKVNEIYRTRKLNNWYLKSDFFDEGKRTVVDECNRWCDFREELLVKKRLLYWFRLFPIRKYYLTAKKYIGDLYYFTKKDGE